ncbi:MAG: DNA polymerase IV [Desulfarculus sp.]|nr:DNA polymerase IV [Desulfarculus sp.]
MDAFYAAVEVLDRPELAGAPVIVGGGARGVVSAASYPARAFGVRSAMPLFEARRRCPQGIFVPVRMERYRQMSRRVMEVLGGFSPLLEQVSVDEAYLDLRGTPVLKAGPAAAGAAIKEAVATATGLTCSVGLAPLRYLAKIASDRDKPDGLTVVADVEAFLATVTLKEVPGCGAKARERLGALGLGRLIELRALGRERLERLLGAFGLRLWDLAHGRDPAGVELEREIKSVSHEETFARDIADRAALAAHLLNLAEKVSRRLRRYGLAGRTVTLKLRHQDFRLVTRRQSLPQPSDVTQEIYQAARELLVAYAPRGPFRLIGLAVSGLEPAGGGQGGLFDRQEQAKAQALGRAEDLVCQRFGQDALRRAGGLAVLGQDTPTGHDEVGKK